MYETYYLKGRDYVHALLSTSTFILVMVRACILCTILIDKTAFGILAELN